MTNIKLPTTKKPKKDITYLRYSGTKDKTFKFTTKHKVKSVSLKGGELVIGFTCK